MTERPLLQGYPNVDLNCRTLDGRLPEEMCSDKAIVKIVRNARTQDDTALRYAHTLLMIKAIHDQGYSWSRLSMIKAIQNEGTKLIIHWDPSIGILNDE
jgi:hypothetical protein